MIQSIHSVYTITFECLIEVLLLLSTNSNIIISFLMEICLRKILNHLLLQGSIQNSSTFVNYSILYSY